MWKLNISTVENFTFILWYTFESEVVAYRENTVTI